LHGDQHGVLNIPMEIATAVAQVASRMRRAEQKVIEFCRSSSFSIAKLSEVMKELG
jgi:regulator of RNase E activity RraA